MAPNISLTYAEIERVCNILDTSVDVTLVPRMGEAKDEVDRLLDNNLVLVHASPALKDQYGKFSASLVAATDAIKGYATQFRKIKESVEDMDKDIADKVNSSGG